MTGSSRELVPTGDSGPSARHVLAGAAAAGARAAAFTTGTVTEATRLALRPAQVFASPSPARR